MAYSQVLRRRALTSFGYVGSFRQATTLRSLRTHKACREVELTLLRALSLGLHLEEDFLEKFHTAPDNQLRLLHYPRYWHYTLRRGNSC